MVINALSFDVEEWFHNTHLERFLPRSEWPGCESRIQKNMETILDLLREKKVFATFFILGLVAEKHPGLVKAIFKEGHEIATHGWSHKIAYQQTPCEFERELKRAVNALESITGEKVLGHRAACFSITSDSRWVIDILFKNGIRYDSSIYPILHDKYGVVDSPRFPYILMEKEGKSLIEFPLATYKAFKGNIPVAGGGYFRLYPYFVTRFFMRRLNKDGHPVMIYLHPPEFDASQPDVKIDPISRSRIYIGIKNNFGKLRRLLDDFRFAPVKDVLGELMKKSAIKKAEF